MSLTHDWDSGRRSFKKGPAYVSFRINPDHWIDTSSKERKCVCEPPVRSITSRLMAWETFRALISLPEPDFQINDYRAKRNLGGREGTKAFWESFLGEIPEEPQKGAVKELGNILGKFIPDDMDVDVEQVIREIKEEQ